MKKILIISIFFLECFGLEVIIDKTEKLDIKTELKPIRDKYNEIVVDSSEGLVWQDSGDCKKKKFDWKRANEYCQDLELGGYDDWNLPTIYQLETIAEYKNYDPAIKKGFKNVISKFYWSSTPYKDNTIAADGTSMVQKSYKDRRYDGDGELNAWTVNFMYGASYHQVRKSSSRYVRCVRELN